MTKKLTMETHRIPRKADGLAVRRRPLAATQFGTFAGVLEEGPLLPEREVFDSRCGATHDDGPEKHDDRPGNSHDSVLAVAEQIGGNWLATKTVAIRVFLKMNKRGIIRESSIL